MDQMSTDRPTIGITMGDPAGIGPEVIVKALARAELRSLAHYVIFGLNELITYAADKAEINPFWIRDHHENVRRYGFDCVVLDYDELALPSPTEGGPSKAGGLASMAFCTDAIAAAKAKKIDAIVTAPISKESWALAGFSFPGHTELLAKNFRCKRVAMMFVAPQIKVVLATIHEQLFEIRHGFTIGRVFTPIDLADQALKQWFGVEKPKIGVCGLNPHAGEAGRFGDEEKRIIRPAILMASEAGIDVDGPFPADTLFIAANRRKYDCIVAMYHDQGLIPVKMLAFNEAVNVTLGLPIIRTSPDHGTAFDIAHRNRADEGSMAAAIKLAVELVGRKQAGGVNKEKPNAQ
jgi:4-phospho-D-threonate 3-dehydrogenase / 4-phospho-D-erythronate 3-dehydrogenase